MANALRYHIEVDLSQKDSPHAQLIRLTGRNKDVLEVGPATGYVTKVLQQRGCRVWCIEMDAEAAEVAAEFCKRMVVGNVEEVDFRSQFRRQRFDVVTFGDVLEHLVDPKGVLLRVKEVLKPTGYIVASVPNIAHSSIRLSLLSGRFQYTDKGLLDRTHLRFFTEESLGALFRDAGYEVRSLRRVLVDPFATELELREDDYPSTLAEASRVDVQGLTYQFVVRAYSVTSTANGRALNIPTNGTGGNLVDDLSRRQNELQSALHVAEAGLAETRDALSATNAMVIERDAQIVERDQSLKELNAQLEAISGTLGYRLLESYRKRMRGVFPSRSWWGTPYRFLVGAVERTADSRRARTTRKPARKKGRRK